MATNSEYQRVLEQCAITSLTMTWLHGSWCLRISWTYHKLPHTQKQHYVPLNSTQTPDPCASKRLEDKTNAGIFGCGELHGVSPCYRHAINLVPWVCWEEVYGADKACNEQRLDSQAAKKTHELRWADHRKIQPLNRFLWAQILELERKKNRRYSNAKWFLFPAWINFANMSLEHARCICHRRLL